MELPNNKKDIIILCCFAYCGDFRICGTTEVEAILDNLSIPIDDGVYMECCRLRTRGFLQRFTESANISRYFIVEEYELLLLEKLYCDPEMTELLKILEKANFVIDKSRLISMNFREWALQESGLKSSNNTFRQEISSWRQKCILTPVMDKPLWGPVIRYMYYESFAYCIRNCIYRAFQEGRVLDWDQLWTIEEYDYEDYKSTTQPKSSHGNESSLYIREYMALYCLLMTGQGKIQDPIDNQWGLLYKACIKLYRRDYASAVKDFNESLKKYDGGRHNDRLIFDHFVFNYLYVMALLLDRSKESRECLKKIQEESSMKADVMYGNTLLQLIRFVMDGEKVIINPYTFRHLKMDVVFLSLANTIFQFVLPKDIPIPTVAIPNYALTVWEADKSESLINRLHVRELWEVAMDEINSQPLSEDVSEQKLRIVYLVEDSGDIIPSVQKLDVHGNWGVGLRKLWGRGKAHDIPEYAIDEDRKVLAQLPQGESRFKNASGFLALADNERLFRREIVKGAGLQQVQIKIEKPYLIVEELEDGSFGISSNITRKDLMTDELIFVRKQDENHYEVMQVQSWEKMAFKVLLEVRHFPASAKEKLQQMLQILKGRTDIHSTLIEEEVPVQKGDARLVVRIYPKQHNNNKWCMQLKVIPFILNGQTEIPGEGRGLYVVTNNEGKRGQLKRDFKEEIANRNAFLDFFVTAIKQEESNEQTDYKEVMDKCINHQYDLNELLIMVEWIQDHSKMTALEMMDGSKFRVSGVASFNNLRITSSRKNNWLTVDGEVKLDESVKESLFAFIGRLDQGMGNYIRLDEQTFCKVSEELRKKAHLLKSILQKQEDELLMNQGALVALDNTFGDELISSDFNVKHLRETIRSSFQMDIEVSTELKADLKPYQQTGYKWMARLTEWSGGACLADDMGLGKTIQTIALMLYRKKNGPALVIAPTSVVANWRKEIARFAPSLSVCVLNESADRISAVEKAAKGTVIVASYGLLISMQKNITAKHWNIACLDEAHIIKNHFTKTFRAATSLKADCRLVLTGTPVQNNLGELWSLFQYITPGLLGGFQNFKKNFIDEIDGTESDEERLEGLRRIVYPFMLRRTKEQVLDELPDIEDDIRYVKLCDEEMAIYDSTRRKMREKLNLLIENLSVGGSQTINALAMMTTLREITCSCSLVMQGWKQRSSKEQALLDLLQEIDLDNNGVLVFSQFTSFLGEISTMLDEEGMEYLYLDGTISQRQRQQMIDVYQSGKSAAIFLISLKAGGVGLNLTRANYVIHLDPWWNPSIEQQATDRVYRIGQKKDVTAYHLIAENTIEEKMLDLHQQKRHISDTIMAGTSFNASLTAEEILKLLE